MKIAYLALFLAVSNDALAADRMNPSVNPSSSPRAEESVAKTVNLRWEPHWLILSELNFDAQFRVGPNFSIGPTFAYLAAGDGIFYGPSVTTSSAYDDKTTRPFFGIRSAYYFMGIDRHSLYLAGFAKYGKTSITRKPKASFNASEPERKGDYSETVYGFTVGYQWVVGSFLTFNAGIGPGFYHHPKSVALRGTDGTIDDHSLGDSSISVALDAGVGIRF